MDVKQEAEAILEEIGDDSDIIEGTFNSMWDGAKDTPQYNMAASWFCMGWAMSIYWRNQQEPAQSEE